jgi:hypothetical protein
VPGDGDDHVQTRRREIRELTFGFLSSVAVDAWPTAPKENDTVRLRDAALDRGTLDSITAPQMLSGDPDLAL